MPVGGKSQINIHEQQYDPPKMFAFTHKESKTTLYQKMWGSDTYLIELYFILYCPRLLSRHNWELYLAEAEELMIPSCRIILTRWHRWHTVVAEKLFGQIRGSAWKKKIGSNLIGISDRKNIIHITVCFNLELEGYFGPVSCKDIQRLLLLSRV